MLFDNKKFKMIALSAFYGAFLIAGLIVLFIGLGDVEWANKNDLMTLFCGLIILALPYFAFLANDFFENGLLVFIFKLISVISINLGIMALCLFFTGGTGSENTHQYKVFGLAVILSSTFSILIYNLKDDWLFLTDNVGYFVIVLSFPVFLGLSYLLTAFFSDYAIMGIACSFYLCCTMIELRVLSFIPSVLFLLICMLFGGLSYENMLIEQNPLNILVFLPALLTVFYVLFYIFGIKNDTKTRLIYIITVSVSTVALTVAQCFVVNMWWIVLVVLAVAVAVGFFLDVKFGVKDKKSSSSASYSGGGSSYGGGSGSGSKSGGGGTRSTNYAQAAEDVCRKFNYNSGSVGQFYYDVRITSYDRSSTYGGNHYEFKVTVDFRPMRSDLKDYEIKCSVNEAQTFCRSLMKDIGNYASRRGLNAEVSVKPNFNV